MSGGHGTDSPKFIGPLTQRLATKQLAGACHWINASDIRITRYRFAKVIGEMHATVNHDEITFRDLAKMVWTRTPNLSPYRHRLPEDQFLRFWRLITRVIRIGVSM